MNTHADRSVANTGQFIAGNTAAQLSAGKDAVQLQDNRPRSVVQKKRTGSTGFKVSGVQNNTIQREKISTTVSGITHLVLAKGNSIYQGQEHMEVHEGDEVEIETTQKLRSRRGPNQESFAIHDQRNRHFYRWFKVISVNNIEVPHSVYIRDDAFHIADTLKLGQKPSVISEHHQRGRQSLTGTTPLREKYPESKFPQLYQSGLIDKFESIQMLLKNKGAVHYALLHLEGVSKVFIDRKQAERPTQALNLALYALESQWMGNRFLDLRVKASSKERSILKPKPHKPNAEREKIIQDSDAMAFQNQFLSNVVQQVVPFKDVGAPLPHGEYAHRIQWYIIAFYYLGNWGKGMVHEVYKEAGQLKYLQRLAVPVRDDDLYRSLWDYVVDLRRTEAAEVVPDTATTYMASPVMITSDLLGFGGPPLKAGSLVKNYPVIAHAIANRRRKRVLENKKTELSKDEKAELHPETGWAKREEWLRGKWPQDFHTVFNEK